jgi:DNA-binding MarR family transcriptional regulator
MPGELAERLHISTPTIVKSANRMEASGLLTEQRDTTDRRHLHRGGATE